jgi:hypothetical protein
MQRRVVEISAGRIVRDEREGGYETTSIPFGELDTAPSPIITDEEAGLVSPTPIRGADQSDPETAATSFPWELRA